MEQKEIQIKLDKITSNYHFIYIISAIIHRDFCGSMEHLDQGDPYQKLNYNEIAFLIGLWMKNCSNFNISNFSFKEELELIDNLMLKLHRSIVPKPDLNKIIKGEDVKDIMLNGFSLKEAFFYSSTGAYDYQYLSLSTKKYNKDKSWLLKNKYFIDEYVKIFKKIKGKINYRLSTCLTSIQHGISANNLLKIFCFSKDEIGGEILNPFISKLDEDININFTDIGDFNIFKIKPIIELPNGSFFIPVPFFLAESIYESPFYWMNEDKDYSKTALKNRGDIAEDLTYNMLKKVFGIKNVFKGVLIKKSKKTTISDIDILCIHDEIGFIFQVKSKKLSALSKKGNLSVIKNDFKKAIENAFLQGLECKNAILSSSEFNFIVEDYNITNRIDKIKYCKIICIVLDAYPSLTHKTNLMIHEEYEEPVISFTVLDLEVVCYFLNTAKNLSDYLSKRIDNCKYYNAENELCFLGYYLEHDLNPTKDYTHVSLYSDWGSKIDKEYYPEISGFNTFLNWEKNNTKKINPNSLCPCESGLKYKKCHGFK